jgi:hypothetical protein
VNTNTRDKNGKRERDDIGKIKTSKIEEKHGILFKKTVLRNRAAKVWQKAAIGFNDNS